MLPTRLVEVEVPDCINVQPWWESSGMTPAAFLLASLVIICLTVIICIKMDVFAE